MTKSEMEQIEAQIDYTFDNPKLLRQAFTRRSYTVERGGQNNEVLEFIGDKVLDFVVMKNLSLYYGDINKRDEYYLCNKMDEGDLTEIKKKLVERKMLARRIDSLGFQNYLLMGKGDCKNNVQEDDKVKEDLFEAIIGAVAIDSEYDMDELEEVVGLMLNLDYYLDNGFDDDGDENYVALVQQWFQEKGYGLPEYEFDEGDDMNFSCSLCIGESEEEFTAEGDSKSEARMAVAEEVYYYLDEAGLLTTIIDEIGEPEWDRAINQLQELAQKGYISYPEYEFEQDYDDYGNPLWFCYCDVDEMDGRSKGYSSSKKDAKKYAALFMLRAVVNTMN